MSTPEPNPYRKLNYPVNNLAQDFNATEKDQVRQNIGIPSSVNKAGKVLKVNDNTGNLSWEDESGGGGTVTDVTVNGTSVVSGGVASVTVPTNTSDLNNDSGYLTSADVPKEIIYVDLGSAYQFHQVFEDWDAFQHAILGENKCVIGIEWSTGQFDAYHLTRFEDKDHGATAIFSQIPYIKSRSISGTTNYASTNGVKEIKVIGNDSATYKFTITRESFDQDIYNKGMYDAQFLSTSPYDFATKPGSPVVHGPIPYGAVVLTPGKMYRCILSYYPQSTDTTFDSTHWEETKFDMAIYNICKSLTDADTVRICYPATSFSAISTWLSWHKQCILIDTDGLYQVSSYDASSITFTRCDIGSNGEAVVYKDVLDSSNVHTKSTSSTLPAYSIADVGKTLQVQADGTLAWV